MNISISNSYSTFCIKIEREINYFYSTKPWIYIFIWVPSLLINIRDNLTQFVKQEIRKQQKLIIQYALLYDILSSTNRHKIKGKNIHIR